MSRTNEENGIVVYASPENCAAVLTVLNSASGPHSKPEIRHATGLSDRVVRDAIHQLVLGGHWIVTDRTQGGYEITRDRERIAAELARLRSHGMEILRRANALESATNPPPTRPDLPRDLFS